MRRTVSCSAALETFDRVAEQLRRGLVRSAVALQRLLLPLAFFDDAGQRVALDLDADGRLARRSDGFTVAPQHA
jgi:hypothetical protein